jgi:DNA-binding LacI/PurR family transcriptional regulator
MGTTIHDVAKIAGVSISTVSRAIANPELVAIATRERVALAVQKLGYRPSPAAQSLSTGRSRTIGIVVPDIENPFFASIVKGAQARARAAGYAVIIADSDEDASREAEIATALATQVDGILLCSPRCSVEVLRTLASQQPVLLINRALAGLHSLTFDNASAIQVTLDHVVALGHTTIALAGGPPSSWSHARRLEAFRIYAHRHPDLQLIELGNFAPTLDGGIHAGDHAIASGATAVIAFNDLIAVGLLDLFRQRGLRVPEDISVAGCDNTPISALVWPALTTVDLPRLQMGSAGVDALLEMTDSPGRTVADQRNHELPGSLIVRGSTGPAPHLSGGSGLGARRSDSMRPVGKK